MGSEGLRPDTDGLLVRGYNAEARKVRKGPYFHLRLRSKMGRELVNEDSDVMSWEEGSIDEAISDDV